MDPEPKTKTGFLESLRLKKEKMSAETAAAKARTEEESRRLKETARQEALAKKEILLKEREETAAAKTRTEEESRRLKETARQEALAKKEILLKEREETAAAKARTEEESRRLKETARQEALAKKEILLKEREETRRRILAEKTEKAKMKQKKPVSEIYTAIRKKTSQAVVALDIGSRYVKLGVTGNDGKLQAVEFSRRPSEPQELSALLSEWVSKHRLERKPVFSSVSGPEINVQYLSLPTLAGKELTAAIKIEAEQILGEDLFQMDSDFSLLGQKSGKEGKVLFIAAPQILSDERVELLKSVGLKPAGITTDGIALANGYLASGNAPEVTMLLNIGHRTSNLAVVEKDEVLFVRDILWGNGKMVTEIVNTTNFDTSTILDILEKKKYNLITFQNIIDKIAATLVEELEKTIGYCRQTLEIKVKKLVVTGGGSQIPSLPEFLAERLLLEPEPWQILKDCGLRPEQKERLTPFCALLTGLSLESEAAVDTGQI